MKALARRVGIGAGLAWVAWSAVQTVLLWPLLSSAYGVFFARLRELV